jgi:hypothetical protein
MVRPAILTRIHNVKELRANAHVTIPARRETHVKETLGVRIVATVARLNRHWKSSRLIELFGLPGYSDSQETYDLSIRRTINRKTKNNAPAVSAMIANVQNVSPAHGHT